MLAAMRGTGQDIMLIPSCEWTGLAEVQAQKGKSEFTQTWVRICPAVESREFCSRWREEMCKNKDRCLGSETSESGGEKEGKGEKRLLPGRQVGIFIGSFTYLTGHQDFILVGMEVTGKFQVRFLAKHISAGGYNTPVARCSNPSQVLIPVHWLICPGYFSSAIIECSIFRTVAAVLAHAWTLKSNKF